MAYTDQTVNAKLSALNDTQESIVTVAQWIMFHRRYADRSASIWLERLKDAPPSKRLTLLYLANEVVQQSKARKKDDFLLAFSPIIVDATGAAYKTSSGETQAKLKRVVDIWRQRGIFDPAIQDGIESKIGEIDKAGSSGRKTLMGGSLFSSGSGSVPSELENLANRQIESSKLALSLKGAASEANSDFEMLKDTTRPIADLPIRARQLGVLVAKLASAEAAVSKSLEAHVAVVTELEKLLEANKATIAELTTQQKEFSAKKDEMSTHHKEVEDSIMRGEYSSKDSNAQSWDFDDPNRPVEEPLTPPAIESFTPPDEPPPLTAQTDDVTNMGSTLSTYLIADPRLARAKPRPASTDLGPATIKRRKSSHNEDEIPGLGDGDALEGLDADVVGLLQ